jgi:hypothetical protein
MHTAIKEMRNRGRRGLAARTAQSPDRVGRSHAQDLHQSNGQFHENRAEIPDWP